MRVLTTAVRGGTETSGRPDTTVRMVQVLTFQEGLPVWVDPAFRKRSTWVPNSHCQMVVLLSKSLHMAAMCASGSAGDWALRARNAILDGSLYGCI